MEPANIHKIDELVTEIFVDFRDGIEALVKVVDQQGKVLRDLLLALEEDSQPQ